MAGEMTLEDLAHEIRALAAQVGGLDARVSGLDGRVSGLDGRVAGLRHDMVAGFARADESLKTKIGAVRRDMDAGFARADNALQTVRSDMDARFREARDHTTLQFEETRRVINLGLEGQAGLRESMEQRFADAGETDQARYDLLADVARHLRVRTETLETRPTGKQRDS